MPPRAVALAHPGTFLPPLAWHARSGKSSKSVRPWKPLPFTHAGNTWHTCSKSKVQVEAVERRPESVRDYPPGLCVCHTPKATVVLLSCSGNTRRAGDRRRGGRPPERARASEPQDDPSRATSQGRSERLNAGGAPRGVRPPPPAPAVARLRLAPHLPHLLCPLLPS